MMIILEICIITIHEKNKSLIVIFKNIQFIPKFKHCKKCILGKIVN
jgi:hypothetical protein